jgi:hypothetical protein
MPERGVRSQIVIAPVGFGDGERDLLMDLSRESAAAERASELGKETSIRRSSGDRHRTTTSAVGTKRPKHHLLL